MNERSTLTGLSLPESGFISSAMKCSFLCIIPFMFLMKKAGPHKDPAVME